ncbi:hypothetical protein BJV82DRAFT_634337 [Fennellomyces sp. T-0311]|nr:hypothetical protein BJV82DRAFT_634337 [Fennellomyces sp. T-0311]
MSEDTSPISGGAIGGIVVAVVAAIALSLIAILFVKRRKRRARRASISRRVSSFGQAEFFAGPSPASPPPMSQTYGSMAPPVAAGPVAAPAYQTSPHSTFAGPNSTFAPAPFAATVAQPPMPQQQYEPDPWQHAPLGTFTVVSTYTPTLDDEIYVHPGDQVQVVTEYDDGWCLGMNLSRGGTRGVFPKHCIQASASPSMASSNAPSLAANDKVHRNSNRGSSLILDG